MKLWPVANPRSFWEGRRQEDQDRLNALIPDQGEVQPVEFTNHALELYRLFWGCYYDIFNNGGCNWHHFGPQLKIVKDVYGLQGSLSEFQREIARNGYSPALEAMGEFVMDAALKEQFGGA